MPTRTLDPPGIGLKTTGWDGGVNIRDAVDQLAPNEARRLENIILDERGGGTKRKGCESHGTFGVSTDRGIALYTFYRGTSAPQILLHTSAGKLYYTNDPAANPVVWTQIATGLSVSQPFSFVTFNGKAYMSNGVDNYASWDGATYTTFPSAPKGKFLCLWKDTVWNSGVSGLPDRVYSSSPGDAETWPSASWVDIAKGDGDATTALGSDGQFLVVGKRQRTFTIYDPVTFANRVVDFEKGIESHFSFIQFEGNLLFLSRRGLCIYLGDSPSLIISDKIDPLFSPDLVALDQLWQATTYTFGNRIAWALPETNQAYNTLQVEYYPRLGPYSTFGSRMKGPFAFHRAPVQCFTRVRSGATEYLYGVHNNANKFLRVFTDVGTDDGVPFTATLETGVYDFGDPIHTKYLRELRIIAAGRFNVFVLRNRDIAIYRTISIDASSVLDSWSTGEFWGTGTWGPDSPVKDIRKTNVDAYGRYFTFRFQDSADPGLGNKLVWVGNTQRSLTSGEWSIYGLAVKGSLLGVR